MERTIRVERALFAYEISLGKGVILKLSSASSPIIKFLREKYLEDPTCISGDINFLFKCEGSGLKPDHRYYQQ